MSKKISGTVSVEVSFDEEEVFTGDSFYKRVTPKVKLGQLRLEEEQLRVAIIKEAIAKKGTLRLG